jgi:hypothetical protein
VKTTNCDYDLNEIFQSAKKSLISIAIIGGLHYKYAYVQPLFLQTFLVWQQFFGQQIVKVHLLGKKAEGALKRPWIQQSPFE